MRHQNTEQASLLSTESIKVFNIDISTHCTIARDKKVIKLLDKQIYHNNYAGYHEWNLLREMGKGGLT